MVPKWCQNCPKMILKLSQNDPKVILKWSQNAPKMILKWSLNDPKVILKWSQNDPKMILKWSKMIPKWSQNNPKMILKKSQNLFTVALVIERKKLSPEARKQTIIFVYYSPGDRAQKVIPRGVKTNESFWKSQNNIKTTILRFPSFLLTIALVIERKKLSPEARKKNESFWKSQNNVKNSILRFPKIVLKLRRAARLAGSVRFGRFGSGSQFGRFGFHRFRFPVFGSVPPNHEYITPDVD